VSVTPVTSKTKRADANTYAVENCLSRSWKGDSAGKVYDRGMGNAAERDVTAYILAGGKSTRMGADKAFVDCEGRTLLARMLELAHSVTAEVRIVGSKEKFAPFAPVVEDIFRDCGPLGGIHAALRASSTELNLVLAVDTPFVSWAFVQYLITQARGAPDAAVVLARDGNFWQPLCGVYRRGFADAAESALRSGRNRIDELFEVVRTRVIERGEFEGAGFSRAIFRNLNTPAELEAEKRRA
jgi:molybdopterin-guanine dinucleotide biosynthesis protein A